MYHGCFQVPANKTTYSLSPVRSASLILVLKGEASSSQFSVKRGNVVFVAAGEQIEWNITSSDGFLAFRAYCDV